MVYQDVNFKICLSLFGWKELELHKVHNAHCAMQKWNSKDKTNLLQSFFGADSQVLMPSFENQ